MSGQKILPCKTIKNFGFIGVKIKFVFVNEYLEKPPFCQSTDKIRC